MQSNLARISASFDLHTLCQQLWSPLMNTYSCIEQPVVSYIFVSKGTSTVDRDSSVGIATR